MTKVIHTQGTRKAAMARATLTGGKGFVHVNGQLLDNYASEVVRLRIQEPIILAGDVGKAVDISVISKGGGITGQVDACRLAIARALVEFEPKLKPVFYEYDRLLLVADVRQNEVSKPNKSKPRDKRQKSYR